MRRLGGAFIGLITLVEVGIADAAELQVVPSVGADLARPAFDWAGIYFGGHAGYAWGRSQWSTTPVDAVGPSATGALNFLEPFDAFKGTGSFFTGLQAGYNYLVTPRVMLGVEVDFSAPNLIEDFASVFVPSAGPLNYGERALLSGTVRARVGYAFDRLLLYATGGFAWTYDRRTLSPPGVIPTGGPADAGVVETELLWRLGFAAGAGLQVPLSSNWTARLEYLLTEYGGNHVTFPVSAQRFDSDLAVQAIRVGFDYRLGDGAKLGSSLPPALELDNFALHAQTTFLSQYASPFRAPYRGQNSLDPNAGRETWDFTFYAGMRLWQGAELWINPEIDQGFGLSATLGVAGFPSGEAYKFGADYPYTRLHRAFLRQTIDLGGETQKVESGINQFSGTQTADRLVITVGKFGVVDIFDTNKYAHDPRTDFFNWVIGDTGTFDYPADAWAYTYGAAVEWYQGNWTYRAGIFDLSIAPNTTALDSHFSQFGLVGEIEHRHQLWEQPGKIAVTGFLNRGRMGRYEDAIQLAQTTGEPADIAAVRHYNSRGGLSANLEQQIVPNVGFFARAGIAGGGIEPYEFTDVDKTVSAGFSLSGKTWGRSDDTLGLAGIVNGISGQHQAYLNAGGLGILVGDGQLPHPGAEKIIEAYYSLPLSFWRVTLDYQFIANPAYNRDRGPVSVIGARLRAFF